ALAAEQPSAVEPHHYRTLGVGLRLGLRRIDVQIETVLGVARRREHTALLLRAGAAEFGGLACFHPWRWLLRRPPAQVANGRRRIRNAEELADAVHGKPLNGARGDMNHAGLLGWLSKGGTMNDRNQRRDRCGDAPIHHDPTP